MGCDRVLHGIQVEGGVIVGSRVAKHGVVMLRVKADIRHALEVLGNAGLCATE